MSTIKHILIEATELQITNTDPDNCLQMGKQDQFTMKYDVLVAKLGQPVKYDGGDMKVMWCLEIKSNQETFYASIYNNPGYYDHIQAQDMDQWHISTTDSYKASILKLHLS